MYSLKFLLVGLFLLVIGIAFQVDVILALASNDFGGLVNLQRGFAPFFIVMGIIVGLIGCFISIAPNPTGQSGKSVSATRAMRRKKHIAAIQNMQSSSTASDLDDIEEDEQAHP